MIATHATLATDSYEEHGRLHAEEARLRRELAVYRRAEAEEARRRLLEALGDFTRHLREHFEHEEQAGLLQRDVDRRPDLAEETQRLRVEHESMSAQAARMLALLESGTATPEVVLGLEALLECLDRHEAAEEALVFALFWDDEGEGD